MQDIDESLLIEKSLRGDTEAYSEIVERYKKAVYYHCFAIVRDEDAAEDLAQETFIAAYFNLKKFNHKYHLSTWFFKISTNKCLNHLKRRGKVVAADDKLISRIASSNPEPPQQMIHAELHDAVDRLRPKYRAVISLYYWQGMDYAATAVVVGAPVNSVRVWLKRAKQELRKELS